MWGAVLRNISHVQAKPLLTTARLKLSGAVLSTVVGTLVQVISFINFRLYGRVAKQFDCFHVCLERTNRFLMCNSMCEHLTCGAVRDGVRSELIRTAANAPMLTHDLLSGREPSGQVRQPKSEE
jgi:hypothetical protein